MTGESVLAAPEKMEAARSRASLADVFFANSIPPAKWKGFSDGFFIGRASSARGV